MRRQSAFDSASGDLSANGRSNCRLRTAGWRSKPSRA